MAWYGQVGPKKLWAGADVEPWTGSDWYCEIKSLARKQAWGYE